MTQKEFVDERRDFTAAPPSSPAVPKSIPRRATHAAALESAFPLEVFVRRPPDYAAPSSWAGIRKPSQFQTEDSLSEFTFLDLHPHVAERAFAMACRT